MLAETHISPHVRAVAPARRWARDRLVEAGVEGQALDVLVLLVSETVTNAVAHADPPVHLCVDVDADRTRVEVTDGARTEPILRHPPASATGGRGVMFVDELSTRWGTEPAEGDAAKTVWFELEHGDVGRWPTTSAHA